MTLDELNSLTESEAFKQIESCCVAHNWVNAMVAARPFNTTESLLAKADEVWQTMTESDIREAFEGHPRIGDVNTLRAKYAHTASSAGHEQSGISAADEATIVEMAALNDEYFEKFGFIFIVCASGKSAAEMLKLLKARMPNSKDAELAIAAAEQSKITKIRLNKLLAS